MDNAGALPTTPQAPQPPQKRSIDVLPKPDNLTCYLQTVLLGFIVSLSSTAVAITRNAARRASAFVSVSCPRFLWTGRSRLMNEENARMDVVLELWASEGEPRARCRSSPIPSGTPHSA